jgi:hypothetical protein
MPAISPKLISTQLRLVRQGRATETRAEVVSNKSSTSDDSVAHFRYSPGRSAAKYRAGDTTSLSNASNWCPAYRRSAENFGTILKNINVIKEKLPCLVVEVSL